MTLTNKTEMKRLELAKDAYQKKRQKYYSLIPKLKNLKATRKYYRKRLYGMTMNNTRTMSASEERIMDFELEVTEKKIKEILAVKAEYLNAKDIYEKLKQPNPQSGGRKTKRRRKHSSKRKTKHRRSTKK